MVSLLSIELSNFKTFGGTNSVKFRGNFVLVAGPNGSGKSNFLDAIGFAMGAKLADLRVTKAEELVTAEHRNRREAWVRINLVSPDGSVVPFKRSISNSNHILYFVNDEEVTLTAYIEGLNVMKINAKITNLLVFQESIETIIMKNPHERTAIFEELSGSGIYKAQYDELKAQFLQYENNLSYLRQIKRSLSADIKKMQHSDEKAKEYLKMSKKNETSRLHLILFNLHYGKKEIESSMTEEQQLTETIDALAKKKYIGEKKLRRMAEACEKLTETIASIDENAKPKELEVKKMTADLAEIRSTKQYIENRVVSFRGSLKSAINADDARQLTIQELEEALERMQREKDAYSREHSDTLRKDSQLSETQLEEYEKLKLQACAACANDNQQLFTCDREYKALKDIFDAESTKRNEAKFLIQQKRFLLDVTAKRIEKLENARKALHTNLDMERKFYRELTEKYEESRQKEQSLKEEIKKTNERLEEFEDDGQALNTMKKKDEIVDTLKRHFGGVYNRLSHMCTPIHPRYAVAVTKVFGKNVDSIVVEDAKTAMRCIKFLKYSKIGIETFLPLDQLRECKLSDSLRNIKNPQNVKLVYDVINFRPASIAKALFYATQNALLCDTPEDASTVAFHMSNDRHDCVSLDGCYYRKSGIISGGNLDLARKAKRWESNVKDSLKAEKDNLTKNLQETLNAAPKESDLKLLATTMTSLACRLKFIESDEIKARKELDSIKLELIPLEKAFQAIESNWTEAKLNMEKAFEEMNQLKSKIEAKEKKIFARFCRSIGVECIQEHENGKAIYVKTMSDFDKQIDRINDQLTFEHNRDTKSNVERWEQNLNKARNELASLVEQEILKERLLDEATRELEISRQEYLNVENELNNLENKMYFLRDVIAAKAIEYKSLSKNLSKIQLAIDRKKSEFHAILMEAKINGFSIVSTSGRTTDLSQTSEISASISETYELDANLEIDYSKLPEDLLDLDEQEIGRERKRLETIIVEQAKEIQAMTDPNMKASQHLILANEKLVETNHKIDRVRRLLKDARGSFDDVKDGRLSKFSKFFDHASERVDAIYKKLTRDQGAQAYLIAENPEEPYLGGIRYECVVPKKRFQENVNLSGGEKTMAALPLLFAIQSDNDEPPPFQILDEIDAALDHKNSIRVVTYLKEVNPCRSIVVSHKREFLHGADSIIGMHRSGDDSMAETKIITLDLSRYRDR